MYRLAGSRPLKVHRYGNLNLWEFVFEGHPRRAGYLPVTVPTRPSEPACMHLSVHTSISKPAGGLPVMVHSRTIKKKGRKLNITDACSQPQYLL